VAQAADIDQLTAVWTDVLAAERDDRMLGPRVSRYGL
jgi:hypothetical protein